MTITLDRFKFMPLDVLTTPPVSKQFDRNRERKNMPTPPGTRG